MENTPKSFDAIAFKEEMQRRAEENLAGLPPAERIRRMHQEIESGPLGEWWASLRRPVSSGKYTSLS